MLKRGFWRLPMALVLVMTAASPAIAQAMGNFSDSNAALVRMWQIDRNGNATHLPTAFACPAAIGPLHRSKLWASDVSALNGNCEYEFDGGNLTILFQQMPAALPLDMFVMLQATVKMTEKDAVPLPADQGAFEAELPWKHALYSVRDTRRLGLWGVKLASWNISIKANFDAKDTQAILSALKDYAAPLKTANDAQLAACGALPSLKADGRRTDALVKDEKALLMLSTMAATDASWMVRPETAPQAAAKAPPNWCVQDVLGVRGSNLSMIYYRHPPEDAGPLDRIVATDGSFAVVVVRDYLAASGGAANRLHYVYVESPETYWLVGFYDGRPPLADLFRYARAPDVTAYASIDRKDGNVVMYGPGCKRPAINNGVFPARMPEGCAAQAPAMPKPD